MTAASPYFVSDTATLKACLRLTGLPTDKDGEALLFQAMREARDAIFRKLGASFMANLQAIPHADSPTTAEQFQRTRAESVEIKLVRRRLMTSMPMLFLDSAGDSGQAFDSEGAFRSSGPRLDKLQEALDAEIDADFTVLLGDVEVGEETSGHSDTISPDPEAKIYVPGGTLFA